MGDEKPSESFQQGVEAGQEGKSSSDNPHESGVIERTIGAATSVTLGGLVDPIADSDKAASEWEAGRQEGEQMAKDSD